VAWLELYPDICLKELKNLTEISGRIANIRDMKLHKFVLYVTFDPVLILMECYETISFNVISSSVRERKFSYEVSDELVREYKVR
jgi:hypothetical protein